MFPRADPFIVQNLLHMLEERREEFRIHDMAGQPISGPAEFNICSAVAEDLDPTLFAFPGIPLHDQLRTEETGRRRAERMPEHSADPAQVEVEHGPATEHRKQIFHFLSSGSGIRSRSGLASSTSVRLELDRISHFYIIFYALRGFSETGFFPVNTATGKIR